MFTKIDKIKLDNYFNELAKIYKKKSHGYIFDEKYNNAINEANVKEILKLLKKKQEK